MIKIKEAVIVEGKYDKIKLSSIIDAVIIETGGFSVFNDRERMELIRRLALTRGILIITDSDRAGFLIRHYIGGSLPKGCVKHAYIPEICGKEPRKQQPSREGLLGVEGVPKEAIVHSLRNAGVICEEAGKPMRKISKTDLFEDGLTGCPESSLKRGKLLKRLDLPSRLSSNSMLDILNAMVEFDEYKKLIKELFEN